MSLSRGTLDPGASANLLVPQANPIDDICNTPTSDSKRIVGNRLRHQQQTFRTPV